MEATKPDSWPIYTGADAPDRRTKRIRVVVVGSGWGAMSFIKAMRKEDSENYDVTLISPRNYFLYTPLLPAVATGTIEERSIVEPVRRILRGKGNYFEATVEQILPDEKAVVACFPRDVGFPEACFKVPYDMLVVAVGSVNNTFGIKGVKEHTLSFRGIRDATALRRQVSECFERAALPHTPPQERKKLLSFVIVGGGPTGVEVAAELHDMIQEDLRKVYEGLMKDVNIRVIELQDHVLSMYDRQISAYTQKEFSRGGINLVFNSRVAAVDKEQVTVVNNLTKEEYTIPFGACVWSTGVAMHPLLKQLQERMPEGTQTHFRSIVTDPYLRAIGSDGTIIALGDGATVEQAKSLDKASDLFDAADTNKDGKLQVKELTEVLREASAEFPQLAEHASFLDEKFGGPRRWGNMVGEMLRKAAAKQAPPGSPVTDFTPETEVTKEEFEALLEKIDQGLRALPATAQVAKQQGQYLAKLLRAGIAPGKLPEGVEPFKYSHKGSLAYVGRDRAVMDVPGLGPLTGFFAGLAWKGFETYSQFSFRNVCLVTIDWVRTKLFGRDISRV